MVAGASLLVLIAVGFGWARSLLDVGRAASFGFAPAFGITVLVVLGTVAARAGVPLGGPAGIAIVPICLGAGWLPVIMRSRQGLGEREPCERGHDDRAEQHPQPEQHLTPAVPWSGRRPMGSVPLCQLDVFEARLVDGASMSAVRSQVIVGGSVLHDGKGSELGQVLHRHEEGVGS